MGLDWGFVLRNKTDKSIKVNLISFSGWNTKETLEKITSFSSGTTDDDYKIIDLEKLFLWGEKLRKIKKIFANVSDREIENCLFNKKVDKEYADLCYELDISYDSIIIFQLINLSNFIDFLCSSDLFREYITKNKDNYLVLFESF